MTIANRTMGPRKFTGWHMIGVMVLFFGTIISVNLTLAWYATQSWSGLVVKNSYVASQEFNGVTAEKIRQAELGWRTNFTHDGNSVSVDLSDNKGIEISDAVVTVRIGRPATEVEDRTVQMKDMGNGHYTGQTELAPGIWQADMDVIGPKGEVWSKSYRFLVKG